MLKQVIPDPEPRPDRCETCRYSEPEGGGTVVCREGPPTTVFNIAMRIYTLVFPSPHNNEWCHRWAKILSQPELEEEPLKKGFFRCVICRGDYEMAKFGATFEIFDRLNEYRLSVCCLCADKKVKDLDESAPDQKSLPGMENGKT